MGRLLTAGRATLQFARRWVPRIIRWLLVFSVLTVGTIAAIGILILRRQGDIPPLGPQVGALAAMTAVALLAVALWLVPRRQVRAFGAEMSAAERATAEDRFRRTLAGILGGTILLLMLGGGLRTAALTQTSALSERLARATTQLASAQVVARVAGVHTLEGIAVTSEELRRPAYEVLLAFVRQRATADSARDPLDPAPDVLAAVAAVSRRADDGGSVPLRPDFSGANLRGLVAPDAWWNFARLRGTHLEGADLPGARIAGKEGSDLRGVRLDSANLMRAHLDGARLDSTSVLYHANLRRADLDGASLRGADLRRSRLDSAEIQGASLQQARLDSASLKWAVLDGATLTGASLIDADLDGASLRKTRLFGTDLRAVRNLRAQQLVGALLDSTTMLPPGVARPAPRRPD